jgi:hypothetical protein
MAKVFWHCYDGKGYKTFIVDRLRETNNLYIKTDETKGDTPDSWDALNNKCHLRKLREPHGVYTMYCLQEELPHFKEKVEASLNFRKNIKIKHNSIS